jgi:hypothetical protein
MAVYFDADISGAGVGDLVGGNSVQFFLVHLTAFGPGVRHPEGLTDDQLLRAGFIAFGRSLSLIGGVTRDYWHPPIWLDWEDTRWVPQPNQNSAGVLQVVATRVRWRLSPGTEGHLYVNGA